MTLCDAKRTTQLAAFSRVLVLDTAYQTQRQLLSTRRMRESCHLCGRDLQSPISSHATGYLSLTNLRSLSGLSPILEKTPDWRELMCGVRWGAFSKESRDKRSDMMMSVVLTVTGSATAGTADATDLLGSHRIDA